MTEWLTGHIDCAEKCEVPAGRKLARMPPPRHAWNDIIRCPHCGDCFLVRPREDEQSAREEGK